jgi:putative transposon-encoded protein
MKMISFRRSGQIEKRKKKIVKEAGNSGRVYVPKDWIDKRVKILLLEPVESE